MSSSAVKSVAAVTDGSIGVAEAAWRGVDLLEVEIQGNTGRIFVEGEDSWEDFLAEPEMQSILKIEPAMTAELERLLLLCSSRRPRGEFTHAAFLSPRLYQLVSFWVRWLPSGHVGIAWRVSSVSYRPRWANPVWAVLGMDETAEAAALADRLQELAAQSFPEPDLDLSPEALSGSPPLPNSVPRRLFRKAMRLLAWARRCLEGLFPGAASPLPPSDRLAGAGDNTTSVKGGAAGNMINQGPLAFAGGGERA